MRCANCGTEVTFSMALRQPSVFRYRCPRCRARHRITAPWQKSIFLAGSVLLLLPTILLVYLQEKLGNLFFVVLPAVMFVIWFGLELWGYNYLRKKATLIPLSGDAGERDAGGAGPTDDTEQS